MVPTLLCFIYAKNTLIVSELSSYVRLGKMHKLSKTIKLDVKAAREAKRQEEVVSEGGASWHAASPTEAPAASPTTTPTTVTRARSNKRTTTRYMHVYFMQACLFINCIKY